MRAPGPAQDVSLETLAALSTASHAGLLRLPATLGALLPVLRLQGGGSALLAPLLLGETEAGEGIESSYGKGATSDRSLLDADGTFSAMAQVRTIEGESSKGYDPTPFLHTPAGLAAALLPKHLLDCTP